MMMQSRDRFLSVRAILIAAGAAAALLLSAAAADATVLMFELDFQYVEGAREPSLDPPWLRATFDDEDTPGSVKLKMDTLNLTPPSGPQGEFVRYWQFNLNPALDSDDLVFSAPIKTGEFWIEGIRLDNDVHNSLGAGVYDFEFEFDTSGAGTEDFTMRFNQGDALEYTITGIPTLTVADFEYLASGAGDYGPYYTVAKIQGVSGHEPGNDQTWIASDAAADPTPTPFEAADINDDGHVDVSDLAILSVQWQTAGAPPFSADISPVAAPDGIVDVGDLGLLSSHWDSYGPGGLDAGGQAVPLPGAAGAGLALLGLALTHRRR